MKRILLILCFGIVTSTLILSQDTTGRVEVKNGSLYYEIYGVGKPTIFLNGNPGFSIESYKHIAENLSHDRQIILFDTRGVGKSKIKEICKRELTINRLVSDLEKLRTHLNIDKFDLVGRAYGAAYALHYLNKFPENVYKTVLISAAGFSKESFKKRVYLSYPEEKQMTTIEKNIFDTIVVMNNDIYRDVDLVKKHRRALKSRNYIYDKSNIDATINWFLKVKLNREIVRYIYRDLKKRSMNGKLKRIDNEILLIHGLNDFSTFQNSKSLNEKLPNSNIIIFEDCGHLVWMDKPKQLYSEINNFLN